MKKLSICVLIVTMMFGLIQGAFARDTKVEVKSKVENLEAAPLVYYTYDAAPAKKDISDNAKKLWKNLNAVTRGNLNLNLIDTAAEKSERITIDNENVFFDVFSPKTNGFIYSKPIDRYLQSRNGESNLIRLLDKKQSEVKAKDYLAKLDLLPDNAGEMYIAGISKVRSANSEEKDRIYDKMQVVHIGRKLDNIPVFGASRIVVRLGSDGELIGIIKNWPVLKRQVIGDAKGVHGKAEWKDMSIKHVRKTQAATAYSSVSIDSTDLVMYDDGEGYIEPALLLKGNMLSDSGDTAKSDWLVPLLADPKANYHGKSAPKGESNR
jgi:hypothetical protein